MNRIIIFLLVSLSILFSQRDFYNYHIESEYQNWQKNRISFSDGYYYRYTGSAENLQNQILMELDYLQAELIIGFLFGKGIAIKEAWYSSDKSSCGILDVMVLPALIIQVENDLNSDLLASL